jgi:hypothetical protein
MRRGRGIDAKGMLTFAGNGVLGNDDPIELAAHFSSKASKERRRLPSLSKSSRPKLVSVS